MVFSRFSQPPLRPKHTKSPPPTTGLVLTRSLSATFIILLQLLSLLHQFHAAQCSQMMASSSPLVVTDGNKPAFFFQNALILAPPAPENPTAHNGTLTAPSSSPLPVTGSLARTFHIPLVNGSAPNDAIHTERGNPLFRGPKPTLMTFLDTRVPTFGETGVEQHNVSVPSSLPSSPSDTWPTTHPQTLPVNSSRDGRLVKTEYLAKKTSTRFSTLGSSIATSVALTCFTEFGDRTFFIAAILALRHPKGVVFLATTSALILQAFFSTLFGQLLHYLPDRLSQNSIWSFPLDDYAAAVLLFVFGITHLKAAAASIAPEPRQRQNSKTVHLIESPMDAIEDPHHRHDYYALVDGVEIENMASPPSSQSAEVSLLTSPLTVEREFQPPLGEFRLSERSSPAALQPVRKPDGTTETRLDLPQHYAKGSESHLHRYSYSSKPDNVSISDEYAEAEKAAEQIQFSQAGTTDPDTFYIFREVFWVIFVAEFGDKSMFSTIALATAQNPYGIFVGSSLAHCLVTLIAVLVGSLLKGYLSARTLNVVGAALFFSFAILTTLEGLARQGLLHLWTFLSCKVSSFFVAYSITLTKASPSVS